MATVSAHWLLGVADPNGGFLPTHVIVLDESSRPVYTFAPLALSGGPTAPAVSWVATFDDTLEDGILMMTLLYVRDPEVVASANALFRNGYGDRTDLNRDIATSDRHKLHLLCSRVRFKNPVVMTLIGKSVITMQRDVLRHYDLSYDIVQANPRFR